MLWEPGRGELRSFWAQFEPFAGTGRRTKGGGAAPKKGGRRGGGGGGDAFPHRGWGMGVSLQGGGLAFPPHGRDIPKAGGPGAQGDQGIFGGGRLAQRTFLQWRPGRARGPPPG